VLYVDHIAGYTATERYSTDEFFYDPQYHIKKVRQPNFVAFLTRQEDILSINQ